MLRPVLLPLFTRLRGNGNSRKFEVASIPPRPAPGTREWHGGASSGSERLDLVAFVAPSCSKGLRLVTAQLPEKYPPSDRGSTELRVYGVLRSSAYPRSGTHEHTGLRSAPERH